MDKVPVFLNLLEALKSLVNEDTVNPMHPNFANVDKCNELITHLQLIEVIAPYLDGEHHEMLFSLLPHLTVLLRHPFKAVSFLSSLVSTDSPKINSLPPDSSHDCTMFRHISFDQFISDHGPYNPGGCQNAAIH